MQESFENLLLYKQLQKNRQWNRLLFWFSFFMSFPSILLLGQNSSVFIFSAMVLFIWQYGKGPVFNLRKWIQWFALLFIAAAITSVMNIPEYAEPNSLNRALAVLPNYLYWCVLIIFLVTQRRMLDLAVIYRGTFWGVVATLIYYLFLQQFLRQIPIFNSQTPNTFAFILICYTPIAIYYLMEKKGRIWAIAFLSLLVIVLLRDGRRAGLVLVLIGGLTVLYAAQINWKNILVLAIILTGILFLKNTSAVEAFIFNSSKRVHEMLYETDKIRTEDRSYLTRVAMLNKGLAIVEKYPYTGIGLNNFSNYSIEFDKSFEGAKYVLNKQNLQSTSAHNSYISLLGEGGLLLLGTFLLIVLTCILHYAFNFSSISPFNRPIYIGILTMSVHLYFISAIVNVFAWYLIALASALMYRK